jgi:hypothetical protein
MESQPATLTPADLQRFERDGYVVVRQAFRRADALAMEGRWWAELADTHGIRRDDRSTWRPDRRRHLPTASPRARSSAA